MSNVPAVDHLPTEGGKWICGCAFAAHSNHQEADDCRLKEFRQEYVVEPLARGWFCRACGVFNGDEKVFLTKCRNCEADRPKIDGADELWTLRYVMLWLPERLCTDLNGRVPLVSIRESVNSFIKDAVEAGAGKALREQLESVPGNKCHFCDPSEQSHVVATVHDRRGCVHVCIEHAKLRLNLLPAYGHSLDCTVLRGQQ